ncbi:Low temperature viability protein-domain-containing protein [Naematelia encephala]|uniref:Low temperature viability protein-domain-containing protein n=1 Tax=Naematelia encephala TaxID=71784 RepID=A0A1Y2BIV8_9TREE|nr:Low temperature viability protein-domain-containing protein [Naematelia encephala]
MPPKKSIFRAPGAQHFQLVHRSQRDPLINDPDASQRVLKPVERGNDRKTGTTLADLDASLDKSAIRANEGEAALYGITYDDSSYDYMKHLKPLGGGDALESVLIAGPKGSAVAKGMKGNDRKGKGKATDLFDLLPEGVLASTEEMSPQKAWAREAAIPEELQGLQPDMDPHLRQVLEALEDDAFVADDDEEEEDDWFEELVKGGERAEDEQGDEFEFSEWGLDGPKQHDGVQDGGQGEGEGEESWQDRFKAFKAQRRQAVNDENGDDGDEDEVERSEMADTIGSLVSGLGDMMVNGGKKRRGKRGPSDASGMSMSSSSMFRTQGLRDLDDRFDKVERDYLVDEDDEDDDFPDDDDVSFAPSMMSSTSRVSLYSTTSAAPPEISRDDFESIMDDFLENYEIVGRRLRQSLGTTGLSGPEKLQVLRAAIEEGEDGLGKEENTRRILEIERLGRGVKPPPEPKMKMLDERDQGDKWDVETILTTLTNTENHPAVIRSRTAAQAKARAEKKSVQVEEKEDDDKEEDENETDSGSETEREGPRVTVARPKHETAEERKARKAAVKSERSARRAEKKSHTATFSDERKKQLASHRKLVGGGRAADLTVGARGVVSLN